MKTSAIRIAFAALCLLIAAGSILAAKPAAPSGSGEFSVTVQSDPDAKPKTGDRSAASPAQGMDFKMEFSGKIRWAHPKMRVDLKEKTSGEALRLQADLASGVALMLYPDTLNGYKGSLSAIDQFGYMTQFGQLMQDGGLPQPEGWKREAVGSETIGNSKCTKYKLSSPKGSVVYWWMDGKERPRRIQTVRAGMRVRIDIASLDYSAKVPSSVFDYGKDYNISEMDESSVKLPAQG